MVLSDFGVETKVVPTHAVINSQQEISTVGDLLRQAARKYSAAPALLAEGRESLTYDRLFRFTRECRYALSLAGVEPGQRIAVAMPPGPEALTLTLTAMTAGVALPLQPANPRRAAARQLCQIRANVVVGDAASLPALREAAAELGLPFLNIRRHPKLAAGEFELEDTRVATSWNRAVGPPFLASSAALIWPTRDREGNDQLGLLTQDNLVSGAAAIADSLALTPEDRLLHAAQHFRVEGIALLLAALTAGNAVYAAPGYVRSQFLDWAQAFEPTWFWASPAMLRELVPLAGARGAHPCGPRLRMIRTDTPTGASLPAIAEQVLGAPIVEYYGMAEACGQVAVSSAALSAEPAGPRIAIVDDYGRPAGADIEGEIVIQGENVMAAYEGDDSGVGFWKDEKGGRWFRTGDQGRMDADGVLYLAGRDKDIIHRGGEKVWPTEVEAVLAGHPAVHQAVVFPVPHASLGQEVGVAIVSQPGVELTDLEIQAYAAERLAGYQVPTRVALVPSIHGAAAGVPQRALLAEQLGMTPEPTDLVPAGYVAPGTETERQLVELWRDILLKPAIGIDDDFFVLGGDSASVVMLVRALQSRFGVMNRLVDRADFYANPTIRAQAVMVERVTRERAAAREVAEPETLPPGIVALNHRSRRKQDQQAPLFLVPALDAHPFYLRGMAEHLSGHQRCYGLEVGELPAGESLVKLASRLAALIDSVCPEGPFYVGGHSFGGVVAYEVAVQLKALGRAPESLYLFDAPAPGYPHPLKHWGLYARGLWRHGIEVERYGDVASKVWHRVQGTENDPAAQRLRHYAPATYEGECVVFAARNHRDTASPLDRRVGWRTLIQPEPEVVFVDGTDFDLFEEPHVVELAAVCQQHLPVRDLNSSRVGVPA